MISVVATPPKSKWQIISQTRNDINPFSPQNHEVLMLTTAYQTAGNNNRTLNNEEIRQLKNSTNFSKKNNQRSDSQQYSK